MAKPKKKEVDTLLGSLNDKQTHALIAFHENGEVASKYEPPDLVGRMTLHREYAHMASVKVLVKHGVFKEWGTHYNVYVFDFSPLGKAAAQEAVERRDRVKAEEEAARAAEREELRVSPEGRKRRMSEIRLLRTSLQRYEKDGHIAINNATRQVDEAWSVIQRAIRAVAAIRQIYNSQRFYYEEAIKKLEEEVGLCHEELALGTEEEVRESLQPFPPKEEDEE